MNPSDPYPDRSPESFQQQPATPTRNRSRSPSYPASSGAWHPNSTNLGLSGSNTNSTDTRRHSGTFFDEAAEEVAELRSAAVTPVATVPSTPSSVSHNGRALTSSNTNANPTASLRHSTQSPSSPTQANRSSFHSALSAPYSDTPTLPASTHNSVLSGATLTDPDQLPFLSGRYSLPPGQTRFTDDGVRMYHLTLEQMMREERRLTAERVRERAQEDRWPINRSIPRLPVYTSSSSFHGGDIAEEPEESGPVRGTEQEMEPNEDYAEAVAAISGTSTRRRGRAAGDNTSGGAFRENWGRQGRDPMQDQRWGRQR